MLTFVRGAATAAAMALTIIPALAFEFEPGQWEETENGTEDGKPLPPNNSTKRCINQADAADASKALQVEALKASSCQTAQVDESGDTLTAKFRCKEGADGITMDGTFKMARKTYSAKVQMSMTMGGKTSSSDRTIEGKWLGACP